MDMLWILLVVVVVIAIVPIYNIVVVQKKWISEKDLKILLMAGKLGFDVLGHAGLVTSKEGKIALSIGNALVSYIDSVRDNIGNEKELERLAFDYALNFCAENKIEITPELQGDIRKAIEMIIK